MPCGRAPCRASGSHRHKLCNGCRTHAQPFVSNKRLPIIFRIEIPFRSGFGGGIKGTESLPGQEFFHCYNNGLASWIETSILEKSEG